MRLLAAIVMVGSLLLRGNILSAQDQAPPDAQTPPATQSAPSTPPQTETTPAPQSTAQPSPPAETQTPAPPTKPATPAPKPAKKKTASRASGPAHKVVVRNGGANDVSPQLSPGMSKEQELHSRETTKQLLTTTEANVKSVAGRQFTPAQQSLLAEINTYMRQSTEASSSGDLARAHTLAYKAHLLSDELRK